MGMETLGWMLAGVGVTALLAAGVWAWGREQLRRSLATGGCPRCGGLKLYRRRRRLADRLFGLWLEVGRYRCANLACQWEGLRNRLRPPP